ncbi:MAG: WYL domain-containing transcriptional regulator [Oscillospiraceae bacterium]|nr:WYL domain-containing transcriptional regulator [Oscillospiraceae bacterium]
MAYSELIKNFEKIRDYMREFYVYGFKSREDYTKKSARSYDDERRRIESWLGGYMAFRHTAEGKNVFISVDNRSVTFNPLHNAWKAKSFTDRDIVLHFCILDYLADGTARSVGEITDGVADMLSHTDALFEVDESTVRKKLKEYADLGVLQDEKHGRLLFYRLAEDGIDLSSWEDAAAFFSEEAPLGVIGSYLLDRRDETPEHFRYKHHYLLHTLDTQILFEALCAMKEKRCIDITNFNLRREAEVEHRVYPLRFYISTQTGREYLLAYHYRFHRPMFFRLDTVRSIKAGPVEKQHEKYESLVRKFDENLWGVSTGSDYSVDHVELTLRVEDGEGYILDRLDREKRHGRIESVDEHTYRFVADVYDAGEMLTWVRSFIGRVVSFESDNSFAVSRFYDDLQRMNEIYGGGEEA